MNTPYKRGLESQLIEFIGNNEQSKNVLVLQGARQVGKTTLLKKILKNLPHTFLNLEKNPSIAGEIDQAKDFEDFEAYLKEEHHFDPSKQILCIDEAQQSLKLGSFVRFMKEEWRSATVILTGSLIAELHHTEKKGGQERRPVGRETFLDLWPMTFKEFLGALGQDSLVKTMETFQIGDSLSDLKHERFLKYFNEYLKVGGLPEVVKFYIQGKNHEKQRQDIFKTYEDDFVRYYDLEDINLFRRALEAVAANVGSPSKDTQAVRLDSPGYKKISGIFARLEKWRLIIKAEQVGMEPEKNKFYSKRYLYDIGILGMLRLKNLHHIDIRDLGTPLLRTPIGGIIENAVAHSLAVQFETLFGIKLSHQTEIDFGVKLSGQTYPIEVKAGLKFKQNALLSLKNYLRPYPRKQGYFFYGGPPLQNRVDSIAVLPFYLIDELKRLLNQN